MKFFNTMLQIGAPHSLCYARKIKQKKQKQKSAMDTALKRSNVFSNPFPLTLTPSLEALELLSGFSAETAGAVKYVPMKHVL